MFNDVVIQREKLVVQNEKADIEVPFIQGTSSTLFVKTIIE
jgi:hypothetical protein